MTNKEWKYPIICGIASFPLTILIQVSDMVDYVVLPPFLAGVGVGVWSVGRSVSSKRVGYRAGLVAGVALIYPSVRFSLLIPYEIQPIFATVYTAISLVFIVSVYIVVYSFIGAFGGFVGNRGSVYLRNRLAEWRSS